MYGRVPNNDKRIHDRPTDPNPWIVFSWREGLIYYLIKYEISNDESNKNSNELA